MNQEIRLEALSIEMPQYMHEPGFRIPTVHRSPAREKFHEMSVDLRASIYRRITMIAAS